MSAFRDERDTELDQQALDSIYSRGKVRNDAINNPGLFTGTGQLWKAPLIGLKVGADSLGKTVTDTVAATNELYAGSLYASHLSFDAMLGNDKAVLDSRMAWSQDIREKGEYELSKSIAEGNAWYKGPAGEGAQVLRGLSEMVPRAIVGGRAFGSLGGAFFLAQPEGDKTEIQLKQQGVDAETAALAGDVTVASLAAMSFLPAAGFSKALMADLGLAVGGNVAIGMAQREQINQVLEQYPEIASQYRAGDSSAIALDALLGAVFFGMARAGMKPTEAQKVDLVNDALTVKAVDQSGNVEGVKPTAKGDVKIVQENKKRGLEALITEKPMPEPEPIKTEWDEIEAKADLAGQKRLADEISAAVIRGDIYQPRLDSELPLPPVKQGAPESLASDNLVRSAGNRPDLTSNPQAFAEFEAFTTTLESGGKATAKASTSSATGKHQFLKDTWLNTVKQAAPAWANGLDDKALLALRTDPAKSGEMFKVLSDANAADLKKNLLPVNFHNMYAMHHFGPGAGKRFARSAANVPMESILGADAVKANKYLAGQTKAQAIANWESRAKGAGVAGESVFMEPRYNADKWFHPNGIMKGVPVIEGGGLDGINQRLSAFSKTGSDGNPVRHDGVRLLDQRYLPDDAAQAIGAFTEATGAEIALVRNLSPQVRDFNGLIDGERILLNESSAKPLVAVSLHEWTHRLEVEHSDLHQMLTGELKRQGADVAKYAAERNYDTKLAMQELTGDAAGDAAMEPKFWARMAKDNPGAFTKLATAFKTYLDGLLQKIGYGSNRYVKDVEAFRDTLAKVMNIHQARVKGGDDSRQGVFLLEQEIGWAQDGGNRISASSYDEQIDGRTKWQAKSRYDTTALSTFWKDRPTGISEAVARSAMAKYRTGEKLVGREVGFIKYALKEAGIRSAEKATADAEYVAELAADDARIQFSDKFDDDFEPLNVMPEASPEEAAVVARANANPNAEVNFGADIDGKPTDNLADAVAMIQKQREADEARAAKFEKVAKAVLSGGKVAKADQSIGDAIATKYRDLMRLDAEFAGLTNGEKIARAAEEAGADAKMMAIKAAQRRALNLAAQLENSERIKERAPELNEKHKFHAALAERLGQLDGRIRGEQAAARAGMMDVLEAAEPNWLGLVQDDAAVLGLAKEVMGESSGDPRLAKAAKAMQDGFEKLRVTANSLGANIGKLDYGYLPHHWDVGLLMHGGKTLAERTALKMQGKAYTVADAKGDYVKDMLEHGNRDALRNEDGTVMDDAEAADFYTATFETLFTEGRNKADYTAGGKGSRASKHDGKHRVIHFKSAESYIAMMNKYGTGTLLDAVMAHADRMAKDIALMDEFGSNPASTFELLKTQAERYDNATGVMSGGATNDMIWKTLNGEISVPVNMALAKIMQGFRNWVTATALQGVMLSSTTDAPLQSLVAKSYGLDLGKNLKNSLAAFGGDTAKEAARLGIVTDYMGSEMALWGQDNVAASSTGKLAEATMRLTGVNRWTYSMRRGAELSLSMGITDWLPKSWDQLEAKTLENFKQSGITRADWEVWQQAGLDEFRGVPMLTHEMIAKVNHPQAERAAARYLGMLDDFGKLAVYGPDVRTRAALTQGTQAGTWGGETIRNMMLFKSFALGMPMRHIRRLRQMDGKSRAEYATAYLVGLTAFGALALQLKQLANGKDPQDMTEGKFWLAAAAQGGGLGILYDIIYKGADAEGRTGRQNYRGLLGPVFGRGLDALELGYEGVFAAAGSKQHAKQFREHGARFVSDNTPFSKIWWYKQAVDQMVGHEMRDVISPGYSKKVEQRAAKYGESYYISPDGDVRAPDFDKATGQ